MMQMKTVKTTTSSPNSTNAVLAAVLGRDLRIGNYVQQGVVEAINSTSAYCYIPKYGQSIAQKLCGNYYKFEEIKPLLITEDILKSFEFKNNGMGWHSPNNKLYYTSDGKFKLVDSGMFLKLKAVHQLQNVYYELYGEWLS